MLPGSSFCRLMEQCLGDQQFVTLLLYLDDICIFAPTIDEMLDRIQLVFDRLKKFNLKIKPKKCQFFSTSVLFLGHVLSAEGISANPEKVDKVKTWPVPKNIKEVQSFLGLASYYRWVLLKPDFLGAWKSVRLKHYPAYPIIIISLILQRNLATKIRAKQESGLTAVRLKWDPPVQAFYPTFC